MNNFKIYQDSPMLYMTENGFETRNVCFDDVTELLNADTFCKMQNIQNRFYGILPEYQNIEFDKARGVAPIELWRPKFQGCFICKDFLEVYSLLQIREVISKAIELRQFITSGNHTRENLENIIDVILDNPPLIKGNKKFTETIERNRKDYAKWNIPYEEADNIGNEHYLGMLEIPFTQFTNYTYYLMSKVDLNEETRSGEIRFLNSKFEFETFFFKDEWEEHEPGYELITFPNYTSITIEASVSINDPNPMKTLAERILDCLCTVHLTGVKTNSTHGGSVVQICDEPLDGIWLSLCLEFDKGRASRCVVCGKPFITSHERSKPRIYCDNPNCQKKGARHPELYAEKIKEAKRNALIQLGRPLD